MGYERAKTEEEVHYKQKEYRKYEKMFKQYAYPINEVAFDADAIDIVQSTIDQESGSKI